MSDSDLHGTLNTLLMADTPPIPRADDNLRTTTETDLPNLDERVDMFVRAMHYPADRITPELRVAIRKRLIDEMAFNLAENTLGPLAEDEFQEEVDRVQRETVRASSLSPAGALQFERKAFRAFSLASDNLSRYWQSLLERSHHLVVGMLGSHGMLRIAAVPLAVLLVGGSVWTMSRFDQGLPDPETNTVSRGLSTDTQAELAARRDIAATQSAISSDNIILARKLTDLARLLRTDERYEEAEAHCTRALALMQQALGPNDKETLRTMKELAAIYRAAGRSGDADALAARYNQK